MELSRDAARKPDVVTAELKKGFEWTTQHSQLVVTVAVILFLAGVGFAVWKWYVDGKEASLQDQYFALERGYLEKKEKFDLFQATQNKPADPKSKEPTKPQGEKPSGDLTQDYGPQAAALENFIQQAPNSKAAAMAALTLSDLYGSYGKKTEAAEVLKKVQGGAGILGILTKVSYGTALANNGDCKAAIESWMAVLKNRGSEFIAPQTKLRIGLCSETLGQKDQAADYYKQVISEAKDSEIGKNAQRYLSLLQMTP